MIFLGRVTFFTLFSFVLLTIGDLISEYHPDFVYGYCAIVAGLVMGYLFSVIED